MGNEKVPLFCCRVPNLPVGLARPIIPTSAGRLLKKNRCISGLLSAEGYQFDPHGTETSGRPDRAIVDIKLRHGFVYLSGNPLQQHRICAHVRKCKFADRPFCRPRIRGVRIIRDIRRMMEANRVQSRFRSNSNTPATARFENFACIRIPYGIDHFCRRRLRFRFDST